MKKNPFGRRSRTSAPLIFNFPILAEEQCLLKYMCLYCFIAGSSAQLPGGGVFLFTFYCCIVFSVLPLYKTKCSSLTASLLLLCSLFETNRWGEAAGHPQPFQLAATQQKAGSLQNWCTGRGCDKERRAGSGSSGKGSDWSWGLTLTALPAVPSLAVNSSGHLCLGRHRNLCAQSESP